MHGSQRNKSSSQKWLQLTKRKVLASILWDSFVRSIMQSKRTAIANSRRVSPMFSANWNI